jgi:hypothetical protein
MDLPIQHFVCHFQSKHLCLPKYEGGEYYWINQYGKRYILADDIEAAKAYFAAHFQDQRYWPKGLHEAEHFEVTGILGEVGDKTILFFGCNRFSLDIRTEKAKQQIIESLNLIKNKIENYLHKTLDYSVNPVKLST